MNTIQKYSVINFDDKVKVFKTNNIITNVKIFDKIYHTIPEEKILNELKNNGIVRFIYMSLRHRKHDNINTIDDFFYIGQHRTTSVIGVLKYFGSGKIVRLMYKEHPEEFEKCYLMLCDSNDDMNEKEQSIVTKNIINMKPYCLNLVDGGNQVNWMKYKTKDEISKIYSKSSKSIKQYCKEHPERQKKSSEFMKQYFKDENNRKYRGEKIKEWNKICIKEKRQSHEKKRETFIKNHSISVSVYDLDGNFIKEFDHSVDCVDYLVNNLKLSNSKKSTRSLVNKSVRLGNVSFHGFQFKHFDGISPLKIKPIYSKISFVVYSNTYKPIYIFHSINQLSDILSPFISKTPLELASTINSRIVNNTPYLNMYYKRIKHIKQDELDILIEELKNSKPTDIFKYIDFNQIRSHRFIKPK